MRIRAGGFGGETGIDMAAALRVQRISGVRGIWEMMWSFAGPDGRATFALMDVNGEPALKCRRIGDQRAFRDP